MTIMQYAHVYVDRKLSKLSQLTYQIPAALLPDICIGSLVDVPLRGRPTRGIVAGFSPSKPSQVKMSNIIAIKSAGPVISQKQIDLYKKIADTTLSSIEDVIFYFLPPKIRFVPYKIKSLKTINKTGQLKYILGTTQERYVRYKSLIEKFTGNLIFVFPDFISLNSFAQILDKGSYTISTGKDTPSKRWAIYNKINNEKTILLTTRTGIGLVPSEKTIIIIDSPSHPGYKEDRRPKFQIEEIIPLRLQLNDRVIVGINHPSILEKFLFNIPYPKTNLKIKISTGQENLIDNIYEELTNCQRALIAIPQKGQWGVLICKKCRLVLRCEKCLNPLKEIGPNLLYCLKCEKEFLGFPACLNCQSFDYTGYSVGTRKIEQDLKKSFSDRTIIRLDKSIKVNSNINLPQKCIVIATHQILDINTPQFDRVFCFGFDPLLDIAKFDQEEKTALILFNFLSLGKTGEIITNRPDHRVYHAIASNTLSNLLNDLQIERNLLLPPLTRIIEIESEVSFENNIIEELKQISKIPPLIINKDNKYKLNISVSRSNWLAIRKFYTDYSDKFKFNPDPRNNEI
jgi:primosomal protein N'